MFPDDLAPGYEGLDIRAGDMASMILADLGRIDDENERLKRREALPEYCRLDTLAMVMIWRALGDITEMS